VLGTADPAAERGRSVGTITELRAHKARQAQELLLIGVRQGGDTLVVCRVDGQPFDPGYFTTRFQKFVDGPRDLSK
jgi:hypothetical protein